MRLLTIATASHLPMAAALLDSAAHHHPQWQRFLLLADVTPAALREREKEGLGALGRLLCCDDLDVPELQIMRGYYDALEFCCALKIFALSHLQREGGAALFLDSDMLVLSRLDPLLETRGALTVTPHTRTPMPADGHSPDDREFCYSGFINGGVILSASGGDRSPAAAWLKRHMRAHCFQAPGYGMFSDQLWLSLMSFYFPEAVAVCDERSINVAYWNLHERPLRAANGALVLESGSPLALFHFSGFTGEGQLSRHSARRFDETTEAALATLTADYARRLNEARARWPAYRGDLGFASDPLEKRIALARAHWQDSELSLPEAPGVAGRLKRRLTRLAGG
jgi:hypothetical protein